MIMKCLTIDGRVQGIDKQTNLIQRKMNQAMWDFSGYGRGWVDAGDAHITPLNILKDRLARGGINTEEYEERKRLLND